MNSYPNLIDTYNFKPSLLLKVCVVFNSALHLATLSHFKRLVNNFAGGGSLHYLSNYLFHEGQ